MTFRERAAHFTRLMTQGKVKSITIVPYVGRFFVDVRLENDHCVYDTTNFAHYDHALQFQFELWRLTCPTPTPLAAH